MPTVEIVSVNSTGLNLKQKDYELAIIEENKLISHRGLFYKLLKKQNGVIVHIGGSDFYEEKDGFFYGGGIIDWNFEPGQIYIPEFDPVGQIFHSGADQQFKFRILDQYKADIDKILGIALDGSPIKKVYFLTDYQFGPEKEKIEIIYSISDFWTRHDNEGLRFNTLYELYGR